MSDGAVEQVLIERVDMPTIVTDGIDIIVPRSPLGQVGVVVNSRLVVAEVTKIPFVNLTASRVLVNRGGLYLGHSIKESTGTASAEVDFYDGQDATGILFNPVTLNINESTRDWYPLPGIAVVGGVYVNVVSGEVSGCIYFGLPGHHSE